MPNKLTELTVRKIALVDEGDNPEANILIFKNKSTEPPEEGDEYDEASILSRLARVLARVLGIDDNDSSKNNKSMGNQVPKERTMFENENKNDDSQNEDSDISDGVEAANKETDKSKDKRCAKNCKTRKGDLIDMSKIDESKLTPEERAQLKEILRKASIDTEDTEDDDEKKQPDSGKKSEADNTPDGNEDIYKGIHPAVKAELESLKKFRCEAEDREFLEIAKRYEIIGKKPEELAKSLKTLKKDGGSAYDEMIAVLDAAVDTVSSLGVFGEIGKRGGASMDDADKAWDKLEKCAKEIRKNKPELTIAQAIDEAAIQHPELVRDYEDNM